MAGTAFLPRHAAPGGMRAGFRHHATLPADWEENRAAFRSRLPMLVLDGERGLPQARRLGCVRQVADTIETALVPNSAHTFASDNPAWAAERPVRFLGHDVARCRGP